MRDGAFGVGTFARNGDRFPGLVVGESVLDLRPAFGEAATTLVLFQDWDASFARLQELAAGGPREATPIGELHVLPPVDPPSQILCAGANYRRHLLEMAFPSFRARSPEKTDDEVWAEVAQMVEDRAAHDNPYLFTTVPSALCGAYDDVVLWGPGTEHDWELELAAVIGRGGRNVSRDAALEHVAGYTLSNDISVRDVMDRPGFPMTDFLATKGRPTFFPTGPYVVPRQFVPDHTDLRLTLKVNGETMQDESTSDIIFGVEQLVEYASELVELRPGDLLLTGSPAGNARHHGGCWLRPGDVMEGEISGIGVQRNRCVAPPG